MKKKIMIGSIILIITILIFPRRVVYLDGGTAEYKSFIYEVTKYHKLDFHYQSGYKTGLEIHILGIPVFKKIAFPDVENSNETLERIVKIDGELYYEVKNQYYFSCEESENKITSTVDFCRIPIENNQANFNGSSYTFVSKKDIVRVCNPKDDESVFLKKKTVKKEDAELVVNTDGTIDIHSEFIQDLYSKVNPSHDATVIKEMFIDTEKFSNKYLIATGLMNVIKEKEYLNEEYIDEIDVENSIKKTFGNSIAFTHEDVYILGKDIYQNGICGYTYHKDSKQYQLMHGCGGNWFESFKRMLVSAKQEGDYIYLKEKSIYKYHDGDIGASGTVYIYNNVNREKLIHSFNIEANESYDINIEDYMDESSTYVYVFKKNNDDYILEKIEREK